MKRNKSNSMLKMFLLSMLLTMLFFTACQEKGQNTNSKEATKITTIPVFESVDETGNSIKSSDFKEKNLYVQFIDSNSMDDIDLFKEVFLNWIKEGLIIIAIPNDTPKFLESSGIYPDEIVVLPSSEYLKMKWAFKAPSCCGSFFLFNTAGQLAKTDFNQKGYEEIKKYLNQLMKNKIFQVSYYFKENEYIKDNVWLSFYWQIIGKENKSYSIVAIFNSICNECLSGGIVHKLANLYSGNRDRLYVLGIVPDDYKDNDIENLKNFLNIEFQIERADPNLKNKWDALIAEYSEAELTNIILLLDKDGKLIKSTNNDQNNLKEFFVYVSSLFNTNKKEK